MKTLNRRTLLSKKISFRKKPSEVDEIDEANEALLSDQELVAIGDAVPDFELFDLEGARHKLSSFRGRKVLLSFDRYGACPTCTYSIDRLMQQALMFQRADIVTLSIFKSAPQNIAKFSSSGVRASRDAFVLIDGKGVVFRAFTERGGGGSNTNKTRQLPADFLIDEDGIVVDLFRAEDTCDHMPFERIEAFIPEEKRCRCNRKDCIVPRCRENYEVIRKEASEMIGWGNVRRLLSRESLRRLGTSVRHSITDGSFRRSSIA